VFCRPIAKRFCAFIPPVPCAIPIPINPVIAPPELDAAAFIASACAPTRVAAAMVGSRIIALCWSSLIISSSSLDALTELTPNDAISIPRVSLHLDERISLRASAISLVWPGSAEYLIPFSEILAKVG
jgi:hypothetical protein